MEPENSDRLIRSKSDGCGEFDALYDAHGQRIYRFCLRLCVNPAEAEDLAQDVFVAAYQGLSRFQRRSSVATWLYRIAVFQWRTRRDRRQLETVPLQNEHGDAAQSPDPARVVLAQVELERALSTLPENWREAFLLVKGEGLLCREAAEVLNVPEGTLKYWVSQATTRLRAALYEDPGIS